MTSPQSHNHNGNKEERNKTKILTNVISTVNKNCYSWSKWNYECDIHNTNNLEKAQINKIERIISKIQEIDSPILEIGCGWGSFMKIASAKNLTIDGITLSKKQYEILLLTTRIDITYFL